MATHTHTTPTPRAAALRQSANAAIGSKSKSPSRKGAAGPKLNADDPFQFLSFVKSFGKGKGRDYWVVEETGDYSINCSLGAGLALEARRFEECYGGDLFRCIILSMIKRGRVGGIEIGFLGQMTQPRWGKS